MVSLLSRQLVQAPAFRTGLLACASLVLVALAERPAAAGEPLPAAFQASFFKKVFAYDRAFAKSAPPRVYVVHSAASLAAAKTLIAAFEKVAVRATAVAANQLPSSVEPGAVFYLFEAPTPRLLELAVEAQALTITTAAELAEQGQASLALGLKSSGTPTLIVHLPRLKAEGHDFESSLLTMARVIRPS